MTEERRYGEKEIAEILRRASTDDTPDPSGVVGRGLTLVELQDIGTEVGIPADKIAAAARSMALEEGEESHPTVFGVPRRVSKTVPISRAPTEEEWNHLVVALRETFGATGTVEGQGDLRSWTSRGIQVHAEPDAEGYRIRLEASHSDARAYSVLGLASISIGLMFVVALGLMGEGDAFVYTLSGLLGVTGAAQLAYIKAFLPRWGRKQTERLGQVAERIPLLIGD